MNTLKSKWATTFHPSLKSEVYYLSQSDIINNFDIHVWSNWAQLKCKVNYYVLRLQVSFQHDDQLYYLLHYSLHLNQRDKPEWTLRKLIAGSYNNKILQKSNLLCFVRFPLMSVIYWAVQTSEIDFKSFGKTWLLERLHCLAAAALHVSKFRSPEDFKVFHWLDIFNWIETLKKVDILEDHL